VKRQSATGMKVRIAAGVTALWTLVAVISGTQSALQRSLQGGSVPLAASIRSAMITYLPWIPVTLVVVWLAVRFPLTRGRWRPNLWIHVLAFPAVTFGANLLVVLGFWVSSGNFRGWEELVRQAGLWAGLRLHVGALIYVAIAGLTHVVLHYRRSRARELRLARLEGQLARARLQALNAQIRPHFLFNTLHTIGHLWRSGRTDEADALLDRLGALFQRVQSTSTQAEVPLEEELDMVRQYLEIEQARHRDRLTAEIEATPEARRCLVPPLLLQPLVENSIRHGISAASSAGRVEVRARIEGDRLLIDVRDDGPGTSGANGASAGSGTGLRNTRERLEQLYGGGAALTAGSGDEGGFLVEVYLPAHREPAGAHDGGSIS
jgi:signal transduction histidine kinase